jgi:CYTH domain-containing protein
LGIDVFNPPLHGLVLAEAEFITDEAAQSFLLPQAAIAEVTNDAASLAAASSRRAAMPYSPGSPSRASNSCRPSERVLADLGYT